MKHYSLTKYLLLLAITVLGAIYALPNLYGEDPSVQISGTQSSPVSAIITDVKALLAREKITYKDFTEDAALVLIRFRDTDTELKAKDLLKAELPEAYTIAANLAPATPKWMQWIGATPMKLGLDLRGGLHFLLAVDVESVAKKRQENAVKNFGQAFRDEKIRYLRMERLPENIIAIAFPSLKTRDDAYHILRTRFGDYDLQKKTSGETFQITAQITPALQQSIQEQTIDQTMTILRNRVNELGVSEAIVQRQGADRIAVDLPGIQDTAHAKKILGGTATLEFHLMADMAVAENDIPPVGTRYYKSKEGPSLLLQDQIVLSGQAITSANASYDQQGKPMVEIMVSGADVGLFSHVTARNIGKRMGIVFIETKSKQMMVNGKPKIISHQEERIISAPVIESALGSNFVINGLSDAEEAKNLALILRAGALLAPITIIEDRMVGPSLGQENIEKGIRSVLIGLAAVALFMAMYYVVFGLIADIALLVNLVLLVAILSMIGLTVTLPSIAGIVLTLGMSVDANILINERIREELRNGMTALASIQAGYNRALTTIVDANVATFIVGLILFTIGTSAVRAFALTLMIGLITSMLTGVVLTRALVDLVYTRHHANKPLSIGI